MDLDMFSGASQDAEKSTDKKASYTCEEGELKATDDGIIIPWDVIRDLFAEKVTTSSGKELKAYITVPRGGVKHGKKILNKLRLGIGAYLKP